MGGDDLTHELAEARAEAEAWRDRALHAEARLAEEASPGRRAFEALVAVRGRVAPPGTARDRGVRLLARVAARVAERAAASETAAPGAGAAAPAERLPAGPARTAVFVLSGGPDVSHRYRVEHQAEQLRLLGATVSGARQGEVVLHDLVDRHAVFVLHRVAWDAQVESFVAAARARGRPVLFDTDDLTFEPDAVRHVAALEAMSASDRELYVAGVRGYRRTLVESDGVLVSTEPLAELARRLHDRVEVAPNVVGGAALEAADEALARRSRAARPVTIAYLSGTETHDRDFLQAAGGVVTVLEARPELRFLVVGPLVLDERFERFGDRVRRLPLQPWERLFALLADEVDVSLAPLEPDNPFTDSKSCVKWIEAGLVGVPTVASPRSDFRRAIDPGRNGLLADGDDAWRDALLELVDDAGRRESLGRAARADVLGVHTTAAAAAALHERVAALTGPSPASPLAVNWFLHSPLARASGGYRNIFRIADGLARRGHRVTLCVEPTAHLEGRSDGEVVAFLEEAFGPLRADVVVGSDAAPPADVAIATLWSTAYAVADDRSSLFRAYFVQDFEPDFYDAGDPAHAGADGTYDLPLRHVCLGRHLGERVAARSGVPSETVDFALEEPFRLVTDPAARGEPVRVLFFARPSLPRRGYAIGLEALRLVKEARPGVEVAFFGSPESELGTVPFEFTDLGVLGPAELAAAMNASHVLLTLSLTNISNVPFEGMACGCAVVDVDLPNVSTMVPADCCLLAEPEPGALSEAVLRLVGDAGLRERLGRTGAERTAGRTWERTTAQFEEALRRLCFAGLDGPAFRAAPALRQAAGIDGGVPERFVPELMGGDLIEAEHFARYWLAARLAQGRRVLDAGCGVGYGCAILAAAGATDVVGADLSEAALRAARARVPPSVELDRADLRELPYSSRAFELVVCLEALEHVDDPERALDELARVLAPGGVLLVSSPNRDVFPPGNPHHRHEFLPEELREVLSGRFGHVRLLRQHPWLASAIVDDERFLGGGAESFPAEVHKLVGRQPGSELLTLALASDAPLPPAEPLVALTHVDEVRRWAERVQELERRLLRSAPHPPATRLP